MIFRPPIPPKHTNDITNIPDSKRILIKDKDKIEKIIQLCKELGTLFYQFEDAREPITKVIVNIPYKEVLL